MKQLGRGIIFLMLLAILSMGLNQMTLNRKSEGCIQLSDFYQLPEHRVDVLCFGSSHVYYGINTCLLYDTYGIASYLLASPGQPVWISYYLLEEALKTQSPQLVVFDIGTLFRKEDDFGAYSWETLISMKPSRSKWNAIQAVNQYGQCLDPVGAFFSFPYYHNRYVTLTSEDYKAEERVRYNGYKPEFTTIAQKELKKWEDKIIRSEQEEWAQEIQAQGPGEGWQEIRAQEAGEGWQGIRAQEDGEGWQEIRAQEDGEGWQEIRAQETGTPQAETVECLAQGPEETPVLADAITERTEHYLRKFIELCQDRGIQLLLVNSPFANQVEEKREAGRYIQAVASEYGVPLLEGNYLVDEMQIDFAKDLLDASHLNYYGSVKYTDYLARWMQKNCSLADRRGDGEYCGWEQESELFWENCGEQLDG